KAAELGVEIVFRQTTHEGELVGWVREVREKGSALVLNPVGYGHTSVALPDALKALYAPLVEVHLSQPAARERFRARPVVSPLALGTVSGFGKLSYLLGLEAAVNAVKTNGD